MYITVSQVKKYFKGQGKQITKQALQTLDDSIPMLLARICGNTGHFKRITDMEVSLAFGKTDKV